MTESNPYEPPKVMVEPTVVPVADATTGFAWPMIMAVGAIGLLVGVVSRHVRPMFTGPTHYEMLATICILTVLVFTALVRSGRQRLPDGLTNTNLAIAAIWGAFAIGWSIRNGGLWSDLVSVTLSFWIGSSVCASLMLYSSHAFRSQRRS